MQKRIDRHPIRVDHLEFNAAIGHGFGKGDADAPNGIKGKDRLLCDQHAAAGISHAHRNRRRSHGLPGLNPAVLRQAALMQPAEAGGELVKRSLGDAL